MQYFDDKTIEKIRRGYFTAVYFNRTKKILLQQANFTTVTMQIFQKHKNSILCGADEVAELLRVGTGYFQKEKWTNKRHDIKLESLADGDKIGSWETVMHITGPYVYFAHLESLYLGILARRTLVATNTRKVVEAAKGKEVVFFADRFDYFLNQEGDGYAAHIGGASGVCTQAHAKWWGGMVSGTIPHALIAINMGDVVEVTKQFAAHIKEAKVVALVDFDNDCVGTSLKVAKVLRNKLWAVRLDTPMELVDISLQKKNLSLQNNFGVNPTLVRFVRQALDKEGFQHVKIIVSGGFDEKKISWFEREKAPVNIYGVGSCLLKGENDFTADVVKVENRMMAKAGRKYKENKRFKVIK